jgi:hypothetical protein
MNVEIRRYFLARGKVVATISRRPRAKIIVFQMRGSRALGKRSLGKSSMRLARHGKDSARRMMRSTKRTVQ